MEQKTISILLASDGAMPIYFHYKQHEHAKQVCALRQASASGSLQSPLTTGNAAITQHAQAQPQADVKGAKEASSPASAKGTKTADSPAAKGKKKANSPAGTKAKRTARVPQVGSTALAICLLNLLRVPSILNSSRVSCRQRLTCFTSLVHDSSDSQLQKNVVAHVHWHLMCETSSVWRHMYTRVSEST